MKKKLGISVDENLKESAVAVLKERGQTLTAYITSALEKLTGAEVVDTDDGFEAESTARISLFEHDLEQSETDNDPARARTARHALAIEKQMLAARLEDLARARA